MKNLMKMNDVLTDEMSLVFGGKRMTKKAKNSRFELLF